MKFAKCILCATCAEILSYSKAAYCMVVPPKHRDNLVMHRLKHYE